MVDRLAELGALQYAAANTATASVNPSRIAASGYIHAMYAEYVTWSLANPGVNPSRLSAKGRIFGYFYDNATFSPLSLFAASEVGAWYDPSDISTMFQDSAGTTPVTADGQPVGKILDKSGRGNHATQATAASRPLYKTDGTYHWLQFDGVDDSLSTAAINFMATDKMSQFYGVKRNTNTYGFVVECGSNALSTQGSIGFVGGGWASAGAKYGAAMSGTSGAFSYDTDASYSAPITNVVSVQNDIALTNNYDELKLRINGVANSSGTYSSNPNVTGTFGNNIIYIGSRSSSSLFLSGNIYSIIIRGALSTTQEITDTETWVNSKTGAF